MAWAREPRTYRQVPADLAKASLRTDELASGISPNGWSMAGDLA
jgi:hypothetical protein